MEFPMYIITLNVGSLERASQILEELMGKKAGEGLSGQERWSIRKGEPSWYDPANTHPCIEVRTIDWWLKPIIARLEAENLICGKVYGMFSLTWRD